MSRSRGRGARRPHAPIAKYSVGVSRNVFFGPFQKLLVNGGVVRGKNLDRFVQYQFGMFDDTRIHGVPASGVRFGELAMVRGSYHSTCSRFTGWTFSSSKHGVASRRRSRTGSRSWHGRCREFSRAVEYHPSRGFGKSRAAGSAIAASGSATLQALLLKPLMMDIRCAVTSPVPPSESRTSRMRRAIAVTGIGLVTALGPDARSDLGRLVAGECGVRPVTMFATEATAAASPPRSTSTPSSASRLR